MAKTRYVNGLDTRDSPVANNPKRTQSHTTEAESRRSGSSFMQENQGAEDVGGRMKQASYGKDYFNEKILGFDSGEVTDGYSRMGENTFDPFKTDTDYEKIRKDSQSTAVASVNLLGQFAAKGVVNTIGGVLGGFYSIGSAVINQDMSKMVDNDFLRGVDGLSEAADKNMSVFTSQADKENGLFGMFSGLETVKSVSDALAFTVGAVASEVIMQTVGNALTGGAAEAGLAGRVARYTSGMARMFSEGNKAGRGIAAAGDIVGIGNRLRKIGEDAELVSTFIRNTERTAEGARFLEKAAMTEGMGMEALKKYRNIALGFETGASGVRKVLTGSMYEGSLEGRQAHDSMMMNAEVSIDAQLQKEKVPADMIDAEKAKRMAAAEESAKGLMFGVMATNIALLAVSNAIQFPSLFGIKSFEKVKKLNANSGMFTRDAATGIAKEVGVAGYKKNINKGAHALIGPGMEFMEETLQGVTSKSFQSYHERLTNTKSHTGGMEHPVAEFLDGIKNAGLEQYGTKAGLEEGIIGAIVGAIGAPSFTRNKNGKLRPTMQGGIKEHLAGRSPEEAAAIKDALEVLNSDGQLNSLKYNLEQSKLNSFSNNEKNKAIQNDNKSAYDSINTDEIFQHVSNYLDKGLKGHLESEKEALLAMSPEEYTKKTRGEETIAEDFLTPAEKKEELDDYFGKVDAYTESYEKVYKNMNMNKMDDNALNKRLLSHLAYALSKDKVELDVFNKAAASLSKMGLKMPLNELYDLAKKHAYLGTFTETEIKKEISSMTSDGARNHFNKWKDSSIRLEEELKNSGLSKPAMKRASNMMAKLEDSENHAAARKELERIENMGSGGVRVPIASMRARQIIMSSDSFKNAKENLSQESLEKYNTEFISKNQDETIKKNRVNNLYASRKFQRQQRSEVMEKLAGKHGQVVGSDIEAYRESLAKYKEQLAQDNTIPKSFLDSLEEKGYADVEKILQELSETVERRETSLSIAANLYGLTGVEKSLRKIAQAELISNYNNNQYYRNVLNHFMKQGGMDDSEGEEAIAKSKLELSLATLKESHDLYAKMLVNEDGTFKENDEIRDFVKALKKEIDASDAIIEFYNEYTDSKDAQERAVKALLKKTDEVADIVDKIKKEAIESSEEEIAEANEINGIVLQHGELMNKPKKSIELFASNENSLRDDGLREAIHDGLVKRNDVTYLRPSTSEDNSLELPDATREIMTEAQIAMYEKGLGLFEQDSTKIADKNIMDHTRFMKDDVLEFDDSDDAALQFFVMTYVVDKEITNDTFKKDSDFGRNVITQKEGNERLQLTSRLYSPYFAFEKNTDKAKAFVEILNHDIAKMNGMMSSLENDKKLTEIEKIELKKKIDILAASVTARTLKANDATLYELRKKLLIGLKMHRASSEKSNSYSMLTYASDFNYGPISSNTIDGKFVYGNVNNFPLIDTGDNETNVFDANDNFLSDSKSAEELFNEDRLFLALQSGELSSLKNSDKFVFNNKQSNTGTEESSEDVVDQDVVEQKKYSTGAVYYMHETKTGISIPVKLFMRDISNSPVAMEGIEKYVTKAIESIVSKNEGKKDSEFKLYAEPIEIDDTDFNGMFKDADNKPKNIHELLTHFAGVFNDSKAITEYKHIISKSDGVENKKRTGIHFLFGTPSRKISEMDESAISEIVKAIGEMRFRLDKNLLVDRSKGIINKAEFEMIFSSGLISHGFETNLNEEKIFSKTMSKTETDSLGKVVETSGAERQVSMQLTPVLDDVLNKSNRILKGAYKKQEKAITFETSLKKLFQADTKWYVDNKVTLSVQIIKKQILYIAENRYRKLLKESAKNGKKSTEEDKRVLFKDSVEAQIALFKLELNDMNKSFTKASQKNITSIAMELVEGFEKQFKDKSNEKLFKDIYMAREMYDNYTDLNELLFNSNKLNNDLTPIMPGLSRSSSTSMDVPKDYNITKEFMANTFASIAADIELSEKHRKLGGATGGGGLPLNMRVGIIKKNNKTGKYDSKEESTTPSFANGKITSNGESNSKVYLNEKTPLMVFNGSKFVPFENKMLDDGTFVFDEKTGKLLKGRVLLNVNGYGGGKVSTVNLFMGIEDINSSNNQENKRTDRYVLGINFIGRDSNMKYLNTDNNAISEIINRKSTVDSSKKALEDKISKKKYTTWEDDMEDALDAMADMMDEGSRIQDKMNKRNKKTNSFIDGMTKTMDGYDDNEEDLSDSEEMANIKAQILAKRPLAWMLNERIGDNTHLLKYTTSFMIDGLIQDKANFTSTDFEKMSDKELSKYIEDNLSEWDPSKDSPGDENFKSAKGLIEEAFKEDPEKTKKGLNELALIMRGWKNVGVTNSNKISSILSPDNEPGETILPNGMAEDFVAKKNTVNLSTPFVDPITLEVLKSSMEFGPEKLLTRAINTIKGNNPGLSSIDLFNKIQYEVSKEDNNPFSIYNDVSILAKAILSKEDQVNAKKIANDYFDKINNNCKL